MLKIFNDLEPFFEDNYRRINVREYARIKNISPPTARTLLTNYADENNLLKYEMDRNYLFFYANRENSLFISLLNAYFKQKLENIKLIKKLEHEFVDPKIILFGSVSKGEINENSDIDIAIITISNQKEMNLSIEEKSLKRDIQLFVFKGLDKIPKELRNNILNGYNLFGSW
jgi:predicted nucleotidyltransferase